MVNFEETLKFYKKKQRNHISKWDGPALPENGENFLQKKNKYF